MFGNEAAETSLAKADCLLVESRRLAARRHADTTTLHRLIADATQKRIGGSLVIGREGRPSLILSVTPLGAKRDRYNDARAGAVVLIRDLERATKPSLTSFARHFGLTPAQTALAQEMIKADGVAAAAKRLGISYATARTHLVQIFQKTGTRRQSELVRLMTQWAEGLALSEITSVRGYSRSRN